ncbi:flagellar brake protein [Nitrosovibrio sp. Nv17]|uniref:flagellar brake protein n=1 Tax=Nitrosovibrio sp. Nv17 TaxID=1855339 RepID=UPI000908ECD9|nr:flagellar brake protein [Nitrosovibrio sp. Nv17]SFW30427.1 regulator YcgR [Nitrosovibrio sp. Nv17]
MPEQGDNESYRIYSGTGILSILKSVMRTGSLLTCQCGDGKDPVLTTIIDIDAEQRTLALDCGSDDALGRVLKAEKLNITTFPDGVKIQFECDDVEKARINGRDVFLMPVPETLLRIQKREYFRASVPEIVPAKCIIPLPVRKRDVPPAVEVALHDISRGGVAIIDTHSAIEFKEGVIYRDCLMELPGVGAARANLQVCDASRDFRQPGQRIRCVYVDPQEYMLSMVQRYINRLELERNRVR